MGRKATTGVRRKGRARWVVLAGLALFGGLGYVAWQQAHALAARSVHLVFENGDTDIGRVWIDFNGDVVASDVVLYLASPTLAEGTDGASIDQGPDTLRFERLRVRAPGGWQFYLRNLIDPKLAKADVDALNIAFDGFDTSAGLEPTLGTLGPIGAISASPFETEGCSRHAFFVRNELGAMNLDAGKTSFEYDLQEQNNRLHTRIVLSTPGASRVQYEREETLATPTSLLQLREAATSTVSERWDVSDQGFVHARNAFCAKQDGIDEDTFVARHLMSVQRLLETRGLVADAQTIAAYRDFARNGGQLAFGGSYATAMHSSEREEARRNGSAMLRLQGKLEHGSHQALVQWGGTQPRPLDTAGGATFAALSKENGGTAPAVGSVSATRSAIPASPVAPDAVAPQHPQYASSLPAAAPPPAFVAGTRLQWEDLGALQGHTVKVFTMHNEPRTAMLMTISANEVLVRARMPGGHADYRISRESFVRAMLID
jgi:hypothetical protein